LSDAATAEEGDGLGFLDFARSLIERASGGVRVIFGEFLEDGCGFVDFFVVNEGESVNVEVGWGVDDFGVEGFVHFGECAWFFAARDEGGLREEDFAF